MRMISCLILIGVYFEGLILDYYFGEDYNIIILFEILDFFFLYGIEHNGTLYIRNVTLLLKRFTETKGRIHF